ncbi:MAG: hypothetical protein EBZ47_06285 [Chlamydiae bacterium]|nr:hypothetical protein [Chlamydiota bacterium]
MSINSVATSLVPQASSIHSSTDPLSKLPPELLAKIMAYLKGHSWQAVVGVNKHLALHGTAAANYIAPALMAKWIELPIQRLQRYADTSCQDVALKLNTLVKSIPFEGFSTLKALKKGIFHIQSEMARELTTLDADTNREILQGTHPMSLLEEIPLELHTHFQGLIHDANLMNPHPKDMQLRKIGAELIEFKLWDWALETASSMGNEKSKITTLSDIAMAAAKLGHTERALAITHLLPDGFYKDQSLGSIASALARGGNLNQALEIARLLPAKEEALRDIAKDLADASRVDVAREITSSIRGESFKSEALIALAKAVAKLEGVKKALEIIDSIANVSAQNQGLQNIAQWLANSGRIEGALEIAGAIPSGVTKDAASTDITEALANSGDIEGSLKIARSIPSSFYRNAAFSKIAIAKAKSGDALGALDITFSIRDQSFKDEAYEDICTALAERGHLAKALLIANEKYNVNGLKNIAIAAAKTCNVNRALSIAFSINIAFIKNEALRGIAQHLLNIGDADTAFSIVDLIDDIFQKSKALIALVKR